MNLEFKNGVATVRNGRKIAAKVYDRDVTAKFAYTNRYAVTLYIGGGNYIQADFPRLDECYPYLEKHLWMAQAGMVL